MSPSSQDDDLIDWKRTPSSRGPAFQDDDLIEQLVQNFQKGRKVFESSQRLHDRLLPRVGTYFRRRGVPTHLIDDLNQETFLRVFHGIEGLRMERSSESFYAWVSEIAANVFNNWLRSGKAQKREGVEVSLTGSPREQGQEDPELHLIHDRPDPFVQLAEK